jgi:hypothetical protein
LIREDVAFETNKSKATTPEMQLLATLLYMRSSISQIQVGDLLGLSQRTVSECVYRVTAALTNLADDFIIFPTTNEVINQGRSTQYFSILGH